MTRRLPKEVKELHERERHQERIQLLQLYGYEYISGYKNCESKVKVRCLKCGNVFEYGYHNLMNICKGQSNHKKTVACPNCYELSKDHTKDIQKLLEKQNKRLTYQISNRDKQFKLISKYLRKNTKHICKCSNCGSQFINDKDIKYCSKKCRSRYLQRRKDMLRDKRIVSKEHENITLDKLYKRDNGICYLCGGKCDYKDYKVIDGVFIVGNNYPNIEHIKPIAKGGTNTWNNVKLAHHRCNYLKGIKEIELNPLGCQF